MILPRQVKGVPQSVSVKGLFSFTRMTCHFFIRKSNDSLFNTKKVMTCNFFRRKSKNLSFFVTGASVAVKYSKIPQQVSKVRFGL